MKYEIIRKELRGTIKLCTQTFEDKNLFALIAEDEDYIILLDGKDVTEMYRLNDKNI